MKIIQNGNKDSKDYEVLVYEDIGDGWFGGLSAKAFNSALHNLGKIDNLTVRINSYGGSVFDGISMYNYLRELASKGSNVKTVCDGIAASIASLIFLAGDERSMASNGFLMIHNPAGFAFGEAKVLRKEADLLDSVKDSTLISTYIDRTGNEQQTLSDWMEAETWFNSEQGVSFGFAHKCDPEKKMAACATQRLARFGYSHVPDDIQRLPSAEADPEFDNKIRIAALRMVQRNRNRGN
jgi:ATP-dependent protease ClpP protease subunit